MKILLDTNIWLRYIIKDNHEQYEATKKLIEANEFGILKIYTSSIIFLELSYVLKNVYHFKFDEILEVMDSIYHMKGITILHDTDLDRTLTYYKKYKIKFSDCLLVSQLPSEIIFVTFDIEFTKIAELSPRTPQQIIKTLAKSN